MARDLEDQAGIAQVAAFLPALLERCGGCCEFCKSTDDLTVFEPPIVGEPTIERCAMTCSNCYQQLEGLKTLNESHWKCLNDAAWSQVLAVQVAAWQTLNRLSQYAWAVELAEQVYLDDSTKEWAEEGLKRYQSDDDDPTFDSNGTRLMDGDTVQIIKDLDVKGTGFVAKRGTVVKNIRLTSNPEHVEGRVNKTAIVLKTCFLKKTG